MMFRNNWKTIYIYLSLKPQKGHVLRLTLVINASNENIKAIFWTLLDCSGYEVI